MLKLSPSEATSVHPAVAAQTATKVENTQQPVNPDRDTAVSKLLHTGDHLFHMGDSLNCFYLVQSGALRTYKVTESGDQKIMEFYLVGDVLGFDALADGKTRCAAEAIDTVSVVAVPFSAIFAPDPSDEATRRDIFTRLSVLNQREQDLVLQVSQNSAQQRLVWFLLRLSKQFQARGCSANQFTIPMSRTDIANYLGLAVETVSREFSKLCKTGWVKVNNRDLELADIDSLNGLVSATMECATISPTLH